MMTSPTTAASGRRRLFVRFALHAASTCTLDFGSTFLECRQAGVFKPTGHKPRQYNSLVRLWRRQIIHISRAQRQHSINQQQQHSINQYINQSINTSKSWAAPPPKQSPTQPTPAPKPNTKNASPTPKHSARVNSESSNWSLTNPPIFNWPPRFSTRDSPSRITSSTLPWTLPSSRWKLTFSRC